MVRWNGQDRQGGLHEVRDETPEAAQIHAALLVGRPGQQHGPLDGLQRAEGLQDPQGLLQDLLAKNYLFTDGLRLRHRCLRGKS